MFILYALVIGIALGYLLGGRAEGLARLEFRWPLVLVGGLIVQLILFSDQVAAIVGEGGAAIYVASTAGVLVGVLRNSRIPGVAIVALGAGSNLAAIIANGGYMPAGREAMAALGMTDPVIYSNSAVVAQPSLEPLTDIFALPRWLPFANIFSIGDVLIGLGVVVVIVAAMRTRTAAPRPLEPSTEPA
jgi:hypothetical protein